MLNLKYLPIHFTLFLVTGILLGYYFDFSMIILLIFVVACIAVLFYLNYKARSSFSQPVLFSIFTAIGFLCIGMISIQLQDPKYQKTHYLNNYIPNNHITIKIISVLKSNKYYQKYEAKIIRVDTIKTKGIILLNIPRQNLKDTLKVDDVFLTFHPLQEIKKALNPNEFDYREFLKKKGINRQLTIKNGEYILLDEGKRSLKGYASFFRSKINKALHQYDFSQKELSIINAILLGQRNDISKDLFESYKNAGAIHILAVSGLHIGIILLLLNLLFKPLEKLKKGKIIKLILVIFCLWVYAFLAGMSASVIRAVTMFTAIAIGWISNRPSSVKNSLIVSFFFLLLIHPLFLFDVGFQLSYTAVFSIVLMQPLLAQLWNPKWRLVKYFWQLLTVSFAAQIGILPLSLYYFHQFPGLFFVSSLVIIPFLGIIIGFGILTITLALFQILPIFLADTYGFIISQMNNFVDLIAQQESFIFQNIYFSFILMIAFYILLISILNYAMDHSPKKLSLIFISVVIIQLSFIYEKFYDQKTNEWIVFHQVKKTLLAVKKQKKICFYHTLDSLETQENRIINSYLSNIFLDKKIKQDALKNVNKFNNKITLIIDSLGVYSDIKILPETVILTQSPKINLNRLIEVMQPKLIIADGSNYKSYTNRWEETCKKKHVSFYSTSKNGAFVSALSQ